MSVEDGWVFDPEGAALQARTLPQSKGCPSHWCRCEWMKDGQRCKKGDGHTDEHEAVKE